MAGILARCQVAGPSTSKPTIQVGHEKTGCSPIGTACSSFYASQSFNAVLQPLSLANGAAIALRPISDQLQAVVLMLVWLTEIEMLTVVWLATTVPPLPSLLPSPPCWLPFLTWSMKSFSDFCISE